MVTPSLKLLRQKCWCRPWLLSHTPHLFCQWILSTLPKNIYRRWPPPTSPTATSLVHTTTISCRYHCTSPPRVSGSHTHHPTVYFQPQNQLKHKSDHTLLWSKLSNSFPSHLVTCTWSVHVQACPSHPVLSPDPPLSLSPTPWRTLALKLPVLPSLLASAWNPLPHYSRGSLPSFFKVFIQTLSCSVGLPWALYLKLQITSHPTLLCHTFIKKYVTWS